MSTRCPYVRFKFAAVIGVVFTSAPTVSLVRTFPVTVFGVASSVIVLLSFTAVGLESVILTSTSFVPITPLASVTLSATVSTIGAEFVLERTFGSYV